MKKRSGVYAICNNVDGKIYIGSSIYLRKRMTRHRNMLTQGIHGNIHLQRAWDKYGAGSFDFMVVEHCEAKEVIDREQFWINFFQAATLGYNINPVAASRAGAIVSEATRKKMSDTRKKLPPPWLGHKHSDETKAKMSAVRQGVKRSPEAVAASNAGLRGQKRSEETKAKLRAAWVRRRENPK